MDTNEMRERVERALATPEATRNVVEAAVKALAVLDGPSPTPDGDDPTMVARVTLRAAFVDYDAIREALR